MDERQEHVVFFPGPDGSPSFRRVPSREEGVRLVEQLRNADGVAEVSLHSLSEVPLTFRAYYRVEVGLPEPAPVAEVPPVPPVPPSEEAAEEVPEQRAEAAPNGKRGLAFFAS